MIEKQRRLFMKLGLTLSLLILVAGAFFLYPTYMDMRREGESQVDKTVPYPLRKNATTYQKELHEKMMDAFDSNHFDKASAYLAESFIADFYTWTNKDRITDVGGLQYLSPSVRSWVYDLALETNYQDFAYLVERNEARKSLEVVSTKSRVEKDTLMYHNKPHEAYRVFVNWEYAESSVVDTEIYPQEAIVAVIKDDDGLLSIVEVLYGTEN